MGDEVKDELVPLQHALKDMSIELMDLRIRIATIEKTLDKAKISADYFSYDDLWKDIWIWKSL